MVRIGIVSDVHLQDRYREQAERELERVHDRFEEEFDADYVVVLGDLIEHSNDPERDERHLERVVDLFGQSSAPTRYLPGNHDVATINPVDLRATFGHDLWGQDAVGDLTLVFLDSSAPHLSGARGEVGDEQRAFLDDVLGQADDALVFVHHPTHYHDIRENVWFGEYPERAFAGDKKEVDAILHEHDSVRAVFNGHIHEADCTTYEGTSHVTVNAFAKQRPDAGVSGTYAEVTVEEDVSVHLKQGAERLATYQLSG